MNILRNTGLLILILHISGCKECTNVEDHGSPDHYIRLLDDDGQNLWFGDSAIYDPQQVRFVHESKGELQATPDPSSQSVILNFPTTEGQAEEISMQLDTNSTHTITYNTIVFTNNKCTKEYTLSYVKFNGEQVCGSCGKTEFNDDRYINLRL